MTQTALKDREAPTKTIMRPTDYETDAAKKQAKEMAYELLSIIEKLEILLREENKLLKEGRYIDVAESLSRKEELVRTYEATLRNIASKRHIFKALDNDVLKENLLERGDHLQATLKRNHFFLQSISISAKRMAARITRTVQDQIKPKSTTYNAKGYLNASQNNNTNLGDAAY